MREVVSSHLPISRERLKEVLGMFEIWQKYSRMPPMLGMPDCIVLRDLFALYLLHPKTLLFFITSNTA